jgi:glycosyltransferase involved in cell wall biosynthesis
MIIDQINGNIFDDGNPQSLSSVINNIMSNELLRKEMAVKAKKFVAENNGWKMIGTRFLELLKR